jgi:site-specific recombinase XerD
MNFLQPNELLSVLKIAREESVRDWLLILTAYRHGLRAGEVTALRTTDIIDGALSVKRLKHSRHTVQQIEGHVGAPLLNLERGLREWVGKERPRDLGDALFPSKKGGTLTAKSFNFIFKKHALNAGLSKEKAHPHILKHSICNHLIRAGVDIAYVQGRVGHASISSTMKYVSLSDAEIGEKTHNALMSVF